MKLLNAMGMIGLLLLAAGCGQSEPVDFKDGATLEKPLTPIRWLTNYEEALNEARVQNRQVLLVFTGLDWSEPCQKLQDQVLLTPEFADYSAENLILVKVDFPMHVRQPPQMVAHHKALFQNLELEEFPAMVLLNSDGVEVARLETTVPDEFKSFRAWFESVEEP